MKKLEYLKYKYPYQISGRWFLYRLNKHLLLSPYTFRQLKFHIIKKNYEILGTFRTAEEARKVIEEKYPNWNLQDPTKEYPKKKRSYIKTEKFWRGKIIAAEKLTGKSRVFSPQHLLNIKIANAPGKRKPQTKTKALKKKYREHSKNMRGENNPMWGKRWTKEEKISMKAKRKKISYKGPFNPMYGKRHSFKTRDKMSASHTGKRWVVDGDGKEHKVPADFILPSGWFYGRNYDNTMKKRDRWFHN